MTDTITHVVLRPFTANGVSLSIGDKVDASGWKHADRLVASNFMRAVTPVDLKASRPPESARRSFKIRKVR